MWVELPSSSSSAMSLVDGTKPLPVCGGSKRAAAVGNVSKHVVRAWRQAQQQLQSAHRNRTPLRSSSGAGLDVCNLQLATCYLLH